MNELIEALMILSEYLTEKDYVYKWPTNCYNGELRVSVHPKDVSDKDCIRLQELGFQPDYYYGNFVSVKYGSN
jgi:hypothetical protein